MVLSVMALTEKFSVNGYGKLENYNRYRKMVELHFTKYLSSVCYQLVPPSCLKILINLDFTY